MCRSNFLVAIASSYSTDLNTTDCSFQMSSLFWCRLVDLTAVVDFILIRAYKYVTFHMKLFNFSYWKLFLNVFCRSLLVEFSADIIIYKYIIFASFAHRQRECSHNTNLIDECFWKQLYERHKLSRYLLSSIRLCVLVFCCLAVAWSFYCCCTLRESCSVYNFVNKKKKVT